MLMVLCLMPSMGVQGPVSATKGVSLSPMGQCCNKKAGAVSAPHDDGRHATQASSPRVDTPSPRAAAVHARAHEPCHRVLAEGEAGPSGSKLEPVLIAQGWSLPDGHVQKDAILLAWWTYATTIVTTTNVYG